MIQVRALCEKAKEILMDESNVQVLYTLMFFFFFFLLSEHKF
jgi:hypothetical protein